MRIAASRAVSAPPQEVDAFLRDLDNHWQLTDWLEVEELGHDGAEVVVHGPLWIRRRARTRVERRRPGLLAGTARDDRGTAARVVWTVGPKPPGALVRLETTVLRARGRDRLLLALGGRWWLRRALRRSLRHLEEQLVTKSH